jgi:hypothetical protein
MPWVAQGVGWAAARAKEIFYNFAARPRKRAQAQDGPFLALHLPDSYGGLFLFPLPLRSLRLRERRFPGLRLAGAMPRGDGTGAGEPTEYGPASSAASG